ncbi:hypothetical protein BN2497_3775 [Janthinobacterium sp. CG23_2]|nr:hypothetical protein BN2497_3775 [Janthinobacterium sp. CG23_2]CUU28285.1 hypothetical protein BN3177_3775 [Janthinobacterium sp. CG23_2]
MPPKDGTLALRDGIQERFAGPSPAATMPGAQRPTLIYEALARVLMDLRLRRWRWEWGGSRVRTART